MQRFVYRCTLSLHSVAIQNCLWHSNSDELKRSSAYGLKETMFISQYTTIVLFDNGTAHFHVYLFFSVGDNLPYPLPQNDWRNKHNGETY